MIPTLVKSYVGWMALPVKTILRCTAIAPLAYVLNFNLILDQAEYTLSEWTHAG